MIDHSLIVERHACRLPRILEFRPPQREGGPPVILATHPEGARFHCDACGVVWVVAWVYASRGRSVYVSGHLEWRHETRRQWRRRLGLRWWARA